MQYSDDSTFGQVGCGGRSHANTGGIDREEPGLKVLVTGSSGFVGSHIVEVLAEHENDVFGIDITAPPWQAVDTQFALVDVVDSSAFERCIEQFLPDGIVHASALTPNAEDPEQLTTVVQVNALSTATIVRAAHRIACNRIVFLSSAGVYRDPKPGTTLDERSAVANDGSLYAQTKLASERLLQWASRELTIKTTSLRVGPVYGEYERPTASRSKMSPLYQAIEQALGGKDVAFESPDSVHNWIHGRDVGRAVAASLRADQPGPLYNLAGPRYTMSETLATVTAVTESLGMKTQSAWRWEEPSKPVRSREIDSSRIWRDLNFQPRSRARNWNATRYGQSPQEEEDAWKCRPEVKGRRRYRSRCLRHHDGCGSDDNPIGLGGDT